MKICREDAVIFHGSKVTGTRSRAVTEETVFAFHSSRGFASYQLRRLRHLFLHKKASSAISLPQSFSTEKKIHTSSLLFLFSSGIPQVLRISCNILDTNT